MTADVLPAEPAAGAGDPRTRRRAVLWTVASVALLVTLVVGLVVSADGSAPLGLNVLEKVDAGRALRGLGKLALSLGAAALLALAGSGLSSLSKRIEDRRRASREG